MNLLFVGGPQRSGTTGIVHYLNRHPEILLCNERYKWAVTQVRPEFFAFERILDYRVGLRGDRPETNTPHEFHEELLASKEPGRLRWIGDKNPAYVESLDRLSENNPGASFILTYRPLEEVAESFEARSKDAEDSWLMGGFEDGVDRWNAAMRATRDFGESSVNLNVLIVGYHDFFYDNRTVVPMLSNFLDVEIDEQTRRTWEEMSRSFETGRRAKEPPSRQQQAYMDANRDAEAEQWVLDRMEKQKRELEIYPPAAARALARERRRITVNIAKRIQKLKANNEIQRGLVQNVRASKKRQAKRLRERTRLLEQQLQEMQSSKDRVSEPEGPHRNPRFGKARSLTAGRLLRGINRLRKRILRPFEKK